MLNLLVMTKVTPVSTARTKSNPTLDWNVREFGAGNTFLFESLDFVTADRKARDISESNASGLTEVVTYEGDTLFVVATYLRGKKRYQGLRANQAATMNLPPTT